MPGELTPDAACPMCGLPLIALVDESGTVNSIPSVHRTYYHSTNPPTHCVRFFTDHRGLLIAHTERRLLEKPFPGEYIQ